MNDKILKYLKISEDLNNGLVDNIFELKINNVDLITENKKLNPQNEISDMSLNISNLDISKLVELFKLNKKAAKDFFKLGIYALRLPQELITIVLECRDLVDNNIFDQLLDLGIEKDNMDLIDSFLENFKDYLLEKHIPKIFDYLSQRDLYRHDAKNVTDENNNINSINTPNKNSAHKKKIHSEKKEDKKLKNQMVNIYKNVFEVSFDYAYLIKQYRKTDCSFTQIKRISHHMTFLINFILDHIKNSNPDIQDNEYLFTIHQNILEHLNILNLINEIFFYKHNNQENEYTLLKIEIKVMVDAILHIQSGLKISKKDEKQNAEFEDLKRRLDKYKNLSASEDVIFETINL